MDKILTVVVPTYNMEKYLRYCLDSLCVSQLSDALEVLIVNDGSFDSSSAIAHEYQNKYPGIFRVIDKENGNYGSCVNRGLYEASGKYIKILDADDSFDIDNLGQFILFLMDVDVDLVLSDFAVVDSDRIVRKVIRYDLGEGRLFKMDDVCCTKSFKYMQMHAVAYRRENLLRLGYRQTEGISYTDQQWIFLPMITVESVARFDKPVYKYLVGRKGQTVNPSVKLKNISHVATCAEGMVEEYERHKYEIKRKPILDYLYARMIPMVKGVYVDAWQLYGRDMRNMLSLFDEHLHNLSNEVYDYIAQPGISSFNGFEYIKFWRAHKNMNPFIVRLFSRVYVIQHGIRQRLHKPDEMSVPVSF